MNAYVPSVPGRDKTCHPELQVIDPNEQGLDGFEIGSRVAFRWTQFKLS